ncbi:DUF4184 family protein [Rufibacter hautae]|uniref:DUF4184 family protein n=1 Tax=Rufibacter hautae TaxID=2595005 RepID=A0A5B6TDA0_9BACT|nr:DUF4184 family protein [Rufibacter hautae]KAA3438437.1 DUF4184 family protein [Rufibacter hautae]
MPFTFSHPAVVLPFKSVSGQKVSFTAMVLGSMAPDFEFFFRMRAETDISHTLRGIFLFDIPVVVIMAFLYHCWVRNPFLGHLPVFLQKRFSHFQRFNWPAYFKENWVVVITSAFLGVVLHLLCDDFTHHYGYTAQHIPVLAASYEILGREVPGYHINQYLSSLVLGLYLIIDALRMPAIHPAEEGAAFFRYWGLVALISIPTFFLRFALRDREMIMNDMIMTAIAAGLLGVILASSIAQLARRRQRTQWSNL